MKRILIIVLALVLVLGVALPVAAQVEPAQVHEEMAPGDSVTVTKTVTTPVIPPLPDIYFLADTTGSMGAAIGAVQADAANILNQISALDPTAQFGVGDYKDFPYDPYAFQNSAPIDGIPTALAAIGAWAAGGGADGPEGWFYALYQLATDPGIGWRAGSTRIVVMFGDAPAHDPVPAAATGLGFDLDEATVTAALQAANIHVIAISLNTGGYPEGLDGDPHLLGGDYAAFYGIVEDGSPGQASNITSATNGVYLFAATPDEVVDAILAGLTALQTDVWPTVVADPGLSVTFEPPVIHDVVSGSTVTFEETIAIDSNAPCGVFNATVTFWANSYPEEGTPIGTEKIEVGDFTAPTVASVETANPAGKKTPPAGSTTLPGPKGGMNEDGFYILTAQDNCDENPAIWVSDLGMTVWFGPFASGTVVKFTEYSTVPAEMKKMGSTQGNAEYVSWHIILPTDALVIAVDQAGNVSDQDIQFVPPPPK